MAHDLQLIHLHTRHLKVTEMDLNRARLDRLVARHKSRLEQHYGHDQHHLFQARGLAILSLVFSAILRVLIIAFLLIDTSLLPIQTKLVFLPLKLVMVAAFASYVALLNGRETLARTVVAITVVGGVMTAIVLTGGLPTSVAAPVLLLPTIIFFCLYGARAGMVMASVQISAMRKVFEAATVTALPRRGYRFALLAAADRIRFRCCERCLSRITRVARLASLLSFQAGAVGLRQVGHLLQMSPLRL